MTNLYDFNLGDGSYVAEFWTWALFKNSRHSLIWNTPNTGKQVTSLTLTDYGSLELLGGFSGKEVIWSVKAGN